MPKKLRVNVRLRRSSSTGSMITHSPNPAMGVPVEESESTYVELASPMKMADLKLVHFPCDGMHLIARHLSKEEARLYTLKKAAERKNRSPNRPATADNPTTPASPAPASPKLSPIAMPSLLNSPLSPTPIVTSFPRPGLDLELRKIRELLAQYRLAVAAEKELREREETEEELNRIEPGMSSNEASEAE